jgi:hypothetical protein
MHERWGVQPAPPCVTLLGIVGCAVVLSVMLVPIQHIYVVGCLWLVAIPPRVQHAGICYQLLASQLQRWFH